MCNAIRVQLLFHPPEGGLVVGWRIIVVFLFLFHPPEGGLTNAKCYAFQFYCCFTRLRAGFLLAMLLAVELRRSGTSLAKHRGINQTRELRRSGTSLT